MKLHLHLRPKKQRNHQGHGTRISSRSCTWPGHKRAALSLQFEGLGKWHPCKGSSEPREHIQHLGWLHQPNALNHARARALCRPGLRVENRHRGASLGAQWGQHLFPISVTVLFMPYEHRTGRTTCPFLSVCIFIYDFLDHASLFCQALTTCSAVLGPGANTEDRVSPSPFQRQNGQDMALPHLLGATMNKEPTNLLRIRRIPTEKRTTANTNPPILRVW